jgi:hypothetical protein
VPWWVNLAWCGIFVLLLRLPRYGIPSAALGMIPRVLAIVSSVGTLWMLSGFAWFSVMAFYAMTALWPALLGLLWRRPEQASGLAGWMVPLAVVEGAGALGSLASMLTGALLGAPRFDPRQASAAAFATAQVFFLLRTARIS